MAEEHSTTVLRFACACQKVNDSVKVPTSTLPLPFEFCHCNTCRHQSGLLCVSYLMLPEDVFDLSIEGPLTDYKSSDTVTRTFCDHCGANISFHDSKKPRPDLTTGILDKADGVIELQNHIFVPDTRDGGLTAWIPDTPAWKGFPQPDGHGQQLKISPQKQTKASKEKSSEVLEAHCQCRGVQFKITSPNEASKGLASPRADLLRSDITDRTLDNNDDKNWWLCANDTKYLAGTCACRSCRLASGFDIQMWAFVPLANILQMNGEPLDFNMGTLKQYNSSERTYRDFCSTCGATVFWHDESRPKLIDVSAGLLDAAEGARAESWLEWRTNRVSFEEEALNKALIDNLGAGLRRWGDTDSSAEGKDRAQDHEAGRETVPAANTKEAA